MSETSAVQLNRIVQLVAELTRSAGPHTDGVPVAELAARLGTTPAQVQRDVRTLTSASDDPEGEWLQSLSVWQEGDRVSVSSQGSFRRPVRLTPDELLAIRVGLALEQGDAGSVVEALQGMAGTGAPGHRGTESSGHRVTEELALDAATDCRVLTILYAGERDFAGSPRAIEPHQVVAASGHWYIVAWCRRAGAWRHFRADRVLDAHVEAETFVPRADFEPAANPDAVFRADGALLDEVEVRFAPSIARWIAEQRPDARAEADGAVVVTYRVADPHWLARHVLQYGADAEIVGPAVYRAMMRRQAEHVARVSLPASPR